MPLRHWRFRATELSSGVVFVLGLASLVAACGNRDRCDKRSPDEIPCPNNARRIYDPSTQQLCDGDHNVVVELEQYGEAVLCREARACVYACDLGDPCECGSAVFVPGEGVVCPPCAPTPSCGDAFCDELERANRCPTDCGDNCVEFERCNNGDVQYCGAEDEWIEWQCASYESCSFGPNDDGEIRALCTGLPEDDPTVSLEWAAPSPGPSHTLEAYAQTRVVRPLTCRLAETTGNDDDRAAPCSPLAVLDDGSVLYRVLDGGWRIEDAGGESRELSGSVEVPPMLPQRYEFSFSGTPALIDTLERGDIVIEAITHERNPDLTRCANIAQSHDGSVFAARCTIGLFNGEWLTSVVAWDLSTATAVAPLSRWYIGSLLEGEVGGDVAVSPDGRRIFAATGAGEVTVVDPSRPGVARSLPIQGAVRGGVPPAGAPRLAVENNDVVSVYSFPRDSVSWAWSWSPDFAAGTIRFAWSNDGNVIAVRGVSAEIFPEVTGISFQSVLLDARDGSVVLAVESGAYEEASPYLANEYGLWIPRFSPNGRFMVLGDAVYAIGSP